MKPQISDGMGSEYIIIKQGKNYPSLDNAGVAVILFPETDELSFLAVKRLYEAIKEPASMRKWQGVVLLYDLRGDEELLRLERKIGEMITRIEREHQDILEAGTWEK